MKKTNKLAVSWTTRRDMPSRTTPTRTTVFILLCFKHQQLLDNVQEVLLHHKNAKSVWVFGDRDSQHHHHHPLHFVTGWLVAGHSLPAAVHTLRAAFLFPSRVLHSTHPPAPFFSTKSIDPERVQRRQRRNAGVKLLGVRRGQPCNS